MRCSIYCCCCCCCCCCCSNSRFPNSAAAVDTVLRRRVPSAGAFCSLATPCYGHHRRHQFDTHGSEVVLLDCDIHLRVVALLALHLHGDGCCCCCCSHGAVVACVHAVVRDDDGPKVKALVLACATTHHASGHNAADVGGVENTAGHDGNCHHHRHGFRGIASSPVLAFRRRTPVGVSCRASEAHCIRRYSGHAGHTEEVVWNGSAIRVSRVLPAAAVVVVAAAAAADGVVPAAALHDVVSSARKERIKQSKTRVLPLSLFLTVSYEVLLV